MIRALLGTTVGPEVTVYDDSDGLRTARVAPKADIGLRSDTRIHAGYEHLDLQAPTGGGLDTVSGGSRAMVDQAWAGASQRVRSFWFGATVGRARTDFDELTAYSALVQFTPADSLTIGVERTFGFAAISPRTVSLGLTRLGHRAQFDWAPGARYHLAVDASYEKLSDANTRWTLYVSPRAAVARTQRLNLDLGFLIHQFGVKWNLDHGYYDPHRYEYYSAVVAPYWKASENIGVALSAGIGPQRDDASRGFTLGMNSSAEATFGIYREWMLKVHGSVTNNRRLDSGAFRGTSGGVVTAAAVLSGSNAGRLLHGRQGEIMRALITGGAGFIGSHLAEALILQGHEVTVLDDLSTGRRENVVHLTKSPAFRCVVGSVTDAAAVAPLVEEVDVVFHLAAAVGVKLVCEAPIHTIHTNVDGTAVVLEAAKRYRKRVLVASTSEVYGKSDRLPYREDANLVLGPPDKTRWGYATSKLLDEFLALAYAREHGLAVTVVRLFNTVGPRQSTRYGMVLPNFVRWALANEPIVVHGDGTQTRSFTWVGDVVWAMAALINEPRAAGEVFNIGNGEEISIRDLATRVCQRTASRSAIRYVPVRTGVRSQLRRHAAASAGHLQVAPAGRLRAAGSPERHHRQRDRLLECQG